MAAFNGIWHQLSRNHSTGDAVAAPLLFVITRLPDAFSSANFRTLLVNRKPLRPSKAVPGYDSYLTPPPPLIKKALSRFLQESTKESERERERGGTATGISAKTRAIDRSPMTKRMERRLESVTTRVAFKRVGFLEINFIWLSPVLMYTLFHHPFRPYVIYTIVGIIIRRIISKDYISTQIVRIGEHTKKMD